MPDTELPLITQIDGADNHNGGDLHFGPDGYLYASVGDEGPQYNGNRNAQIITNKFFSAILRLDVDKRPGNLLPNSHPANTTNYFIPADNPFVGATSFNGKLSRPPTCARNFILSVIAIHGGFHSTPALDFYTSATSDRINTRKWTL
ncbi:MAG: hypothetical protein WDM80_04345 [Limisphaerales bacterium]